MALNLSSFDVKLNSTSNDAQYKDVWWSIRVNFEKYDSVATWKMAPKWCNGLFDLHLRFSIWLSYSGNNTKMIEIMLNELNNKSYLAWA